MVEELEKLFTHENAWGFKGLKLIASNNGLLEIEVEKSPSTFLVSKVFAKKSRVGLCFIREDGKTWSPSGLCRGYRYLLLHQRCRPAGNLRPTKTGPRFTSTVFPVKQFFV